MRVVKSILFLLMAGVFSSCSTKDRGANTCAIPSSVKVFDLTNGYSNGAEPDQEIIDEMLSIAEKPGPVYVDWELKFFRVEDFDCENGIISCNEGDGFTLTKEQGLVSCMVPVHSYSTHFLFNVLIGSTLRFPYNAISCFQSGGDSITIAIKGYYAAISYPVPTAVALELRPVNPCFMPPADENPGQ